MAKTHMPLPTGGKILPKLISACVGLALLVIVVKHPGEAASTLKAIGGTLGSAIDGLWTFVHQLAG